MYNLLKIRNIAVLLVAGFLFFTNGYAQSKTGYKTYQLTQDGDTINAIDKNDLKQGMWIIENPELRGNPGYEEEGRFVNNKKEGVWKLFTLQGDMIGKENYRFGGKDGLQQYYTMHGELIREENWRAYNPDQPYDTIAVYGQGSNEIINYKIVKAEQYSVKHGDFKFYDGNGRILKKETYDRGFLKKEPVDELVVEDKPKVKVKPKEAVEFDKKNSGKKKKLRDGATGI